ncbi:YolD-like family protein [Bacillus sp. 3255]|uniref:YolD-like family protein n=1 Tax=Bacillus sp. 3255 TaxID=2817904 RepID=UPI00285CC292|nr:YolD-like family protein [Bacillus sp. 3255]MDR6883093.1 hypothetical protein [Bacillus sp. 3255]
MGKKLEHNGLWESSRMMLPQHKEAAIIKRKESQRLPRPIRDDQGIQIISATLSQSQIYRKPIVLTLYDEYETKELTGIVTRSQRNEFRFDTEDPFTGEINWDWINYSDVLRAELSKEWTEDEMIDP